MAKWLLFDGIRQKQGGGWDHPRAEQRLQGQGNWRKRL
ncbi:MAG: hypothetical protein QGH20_00345 [Candidatus Latescibacteria bacterium]|nr:hypothetical protein [Candidatus Latescibacterota bacterium]